MIDNYLTNMQMYYTDTPRHWCPHSEQFTGADSLITALRHGWALCRQVYREEFLLQGSRHTTIYFFELRRNGEIITMPVVGNPFVVRLVAAQRLHVVQETQPNIYETAEEPRVLISA
jgi:hypothetical protein